MSDSSSLNFVWDGEEYFSMSQLIKNRNWTKTLIKKYMGEPCATCPNPHYRNAAPMRLYLSTLVIETENLNAFIQDKARALESSSAARERVITRIDNNVHAVKNESIEPFKISLRTLLIKAKEKVASRNNNNEFFIIENAEEIMAVGCLFEMTSTSMYSIDNYFGMPGVKAMREIMRTRILASIKENFPELQNVCDLIEKRVDLGSPELDFNVLEKLH